MISQRRRSTSQTNARLWKARIQRFLLVCLLLQFIIVGTGLFYTDNLNFIFPKKNAALHVVAHEKNIPVEEKDAVILEINKTFVKPQKSIILEEPADKQQELAAESIETYQKEILPPVLAPSPLQVNNTTGDAESRGTEDGDILSKNINATVNVAEKSEEIASELNFSEFHEQVSQDSTMTGSNRRQQSVPVISQGDESAIAAEPAAEVLREGTSGQYYYTVKAGDTLGIISKEVYGTVTKWRVIANANTDQLENNPNILRPGMKLVIPASTANGNIPIQPNSPASL